MSTTIFYALATLACIFFAWRGRKFPKPVLAETIGFLGMGTLFAVMAVLDFSRLQPVSP